MVNISKQVLDDVVRTRMLDDLFRLIAGTKHSNQKVIWQELLSPDEQIQYAKRITLVLLLARGTTYSQISQTLGMSPSTIARHDELRQEGHYRAIERTAGSSRIAPRVARLLLDLLDIATTPYCGERRRTLWKRHPL